MHHQIFSSIHLRAVTVVRSGGKWSAARLSRRAECGEDTGRKSRHGWIDGHPCPLFSLRPCLFKWPALRSLQPVGRSRVDRVSPYLWLSALMSPEGRGCRSALLRLGPSPWQPRPPPPPPRPLPPLHPLYSNSSQLCVHPYICLPRITAPSPPPLPLLTHSFTQSISRELDSQHEQAHSHGTHKTATRALRRLKW